MAEMAPKLSTLKPMKVMKKPAAAAEKNKVTVTAILKDRNTEEVLAEYPGYVIPPKMPLIAFAEVVAFESTEAGKQTNKAERFMTLMNSVAKVDGLSYDVEADGKEEMQELVKEGSIVEIFIPNPALFAFDTEAEAPSTLRIEVTAKHSMPPPTGNATKKEIAEEIREALNMSSNWVDGLVRADRNSLIAVMN